MSAALLHISNTDGSRGIYRSWATNNRRGYTMPINNRRGYTMPACLVPIYMKHI